MLAGRIAHGVDVRADDVGHRVVFSHALDGAARGLDYYQRVVWIEFLDELGSVLQRRQRLLAPFGLVLSLVSAQTGMLTERRQHLTQQRFVIRVAGLDLRGLA